MTASKSPSPKTTPVYVRVRLTVEVALKQPWDEAEKVSNVRDHAAREAAAVTRRMIEKDAGRVRLISVDQTHLTIIFDESTAS